MDTASILVYRTGFWGDTVVAIPALHAIRRLHPGARLTLVTNRTPQEGQVGPWDVLERTGLFSDVILYDPEARGWSRIGVALALAARIRRARPYMLYYLAPTPRTERQVRRDSFFFRSVCGVRRVCGLQATDEWVRRRDGNGPVPLPPEHLRLARLVGAAADDDTDPPPINDEDRRFVDVLWRRAGIPPGANTVAFSPGAANQAARWPEENYRELARRLLSEFPDLCLVVVGGVRETPFARDLRTAFGPRVVNLAGQLSVWQSAEAIGRCSLFIGNDSGPMHLAALMGVRCVAVFSARAHPGIWDPRGDGHVVVRKAVPCAGCLLDECYDQGMVCLTGITVDDVFGACLRSMTRAQIGLAPS